MSVLGNCIKCLIIILEGIYGQIYKHGECLTCVKVGSGKMCTVGDVYKQGIYFANQGRTTQASLQAIQR